MKIIAVRGRNLASLAETFEIDFSTAPLKDAGLFAITGPTGAGKSTLLDAICLALYNSFPRIADGSGDAGIGDPTPDAERLRSTDPRTILRRGAAECSAEVEFVGCDGRTYKATWSVQRARGRSNGTLQNRKMSLRDVEKNTALGGTLTETLKEIREKVGLNFDQFRRTIMLAQNDFDAFLRADEKARADLLERITGTEIYARISQVAYERHSEITRQMREEETRKGMIAGLDPLARARLEQDLERAAMEAGEKQAVLDRLRVTAAWHQRLNDLESARDRAAAQIETAELAWNRAGGLRRQLQSAERAEQVRGIVEAADRAVALASEAEREHGAAVSAMNAARMAHERSNAALNEAAAELAARETEGATLEPVWAKAAELDHAITEARKEVEQSRLKEKAVETDSAAALAAGAESEAEAARHEEARKANLAWLAAHEGDEPLARRIDDVQASLDALEKARLDQDASGREFARISDAIGRIDEEARACALESTRHAAEITDLKQQESERRRALSGLGGAGLKARCEALATALTAFEQVYSAAERCREAQINEARQISRRTEADGRRTRVEALLERLRQQRESASAALEETRVAKERAEKAAGDQAALLRGLLKGGEPCPVCGATDHPWHGRPGPLDALLAEAQARYVEHEHAAGILQSAIEAAQSERGTAESVISDADSQRDRIAAQHRQLQKAFTTRFAAWSKAATAAGITVGEAEVSAILDPAMASSGAALEAELNDGRQSLARSALLETEADAARQAHDGKIEALRDIERRQNEILSRRSELDAEKARHDARRAAATEEAARMVDRLSFATTPRGLSAKMLVEELPLIRRRLVAAAETWNAEAARRDRLAAEAAEIRTAAERARGHHAAAEKRLAEAQEERVARQTRLARLERERARLFGGTATEIHRRAFADRLKTARDGHEKAAAAHADARAAHAAAESAAQAARKTLDAARSARVETAGERDRGLEALGLQQATVRALLTRGPGWLATTRIQVEALERDLHDATRRHSDAVEEIERHRVGEPAETASDLTKTIAAAQEEIAGLTELLGALREQIAQDDRKRHAAEAADTRIGALRARHDVWGAVSEAIGSAKGDKFRSFVQAITLDQLLGLANEQFATLNPRYRLERAPAGDLSLQIRDLEMGDEVRSVRSLSGGERFLASLALALGLSDLSGRRTFARTLFIDEGFGSLDAASLDMAVSALEALHSRGRQVGVITHVEAMTDRIAVQVRVAKVGGGRSRIRVA